MDRYKQTKVREGGLAPQQINKTLKRLSQVLDVAVDYGHLPSNPAASKGGRRRVKETPPDRSWVQPEQLTALLDAAPKRHRAVLATLAGAGLRVGELCALDWRDLDLPTGTLIVRESKTPTGRREVDLPSGLITELWTLAATSEQTGPDDPLFIGRRGTRQTSDDVGRRLKSALSKANVRASRRSASGSRRTRCAAPTPRCASHVATIRSTSPNRADGRTRPSRSGSTLRP